MIKAQIMRTILLAFTRFMLSDSSVALFYTCFLTLAVYMLLCSEFILLVY